MLRIGARDSFLSRTQTNMVIKELEKKGIHTKFIPLKSKGDLNTNIPLHHFSTVGVFTTIVEKALLENEIDIGIHSLKDLPTIISPGLKITPVLKREDPRDILIIKKENIEDQKTIKLKEGTRIGTGSLRRQAQLLNQNPFSIPIDIRGNIETRIGYIKKGWVDGIILAKAGIDRAKITLPEETIVIPLPLNKYPTSPGQGILAAQYREKDPEIENILRKIIHYETLKQAQVERAILKSIGSGCTVPLGVSTYKTEDHLYEISIAYAKNNWKQQYIPELITYHEKGTLEEFLEKTEKISNYIQENAEKILLGGSNAIDKKTKNDYYVLISRDTNNDILTSEIEKETGAQISSIEFFRYDITDPRQVINEVKPLLRDTQWVVITSKRAVPALKRVYQDIKKSKKNKVKIAAVGESTAREIRKHDLPVHFVPTRHTSRSLAEELLKIDSQLKQVIHLTAQEPLPHLKETLENNGVNVFQIITYNKIKLEKPITKNFPKNKTFEVAVIFSPSQAREVISFARENSLVIKNWVAIGPTTAKALKKEGVGSVLFPNSTSIKAILEVLKNVLPN